MMIKALKYLIRVISVILAIFFLLVMFTGFLHDGIEWIVIIIIGIILDVILDWAWSKEGK